MESEAEAALSRVPEPQSGPWVVFLDENKESTQTFYSLSEEKYYKRSVRVMQRNLFFPTAEGWLLIISSNGQHCFLWNPSTLAQIDLPPPLHEDAFDPFYSQCFLSSSPTDSHCMVIFVNYTYGQVFFCHPASKSWMTYDFEPGFFDATICNGNLYMVTSNSGLAVIDFVPHPRTSFIVEEEEAEPTVNLYRFVRKRAIMESCGEMFLVSLHFLGQIEKPVDVLVRKLDLAKKAWVAADSIGSDRVFFLCGGETCELSRSWSASALGVKGDCVYYMAVDKCLYMYDMKNETITTCLYDQDTENTLSLGFWLMPAA